jgi:triacylglycerol lipase
MMARFWQGLGLGAVAALSLGIVEPADAANHDPIVLVHGFLGFGRSEMLGFKYWGGLVDIQTEVMAKYKNQQIYTVAVGPISSNWDRAVELFYQIKGGCVDYGAVHAKKYGILEVPNDTFKDGTTCFPGFYPQWDANHPIHLIGHSMGGQDSKMLVQMLATNGAPLNPGLFPYKTSAAWVKSVTTISTPNDGTVLAYNFYDGLGKNVPQILGTIALFAGVFGDTAQSIYDFKLEQWGITPQQPGETFFAYLSRVQASPLFQNTTKNFSAFDLGPDGAMIENEWVKDQPGVTYFSWSTICTKPSPTDGTAVTQPGTSVLINLFGGSGFIGNYVPSDGLPFPYSASNPAYKTWWPNDGVVDTIAEKAPTWAMDSKGKIYRRGTTVVDLSHGGTPVVGAWNYLGTKLDFDHMKIIGWDFVWDPIPFYNHQVELLRSL